MRKYIEINHLQADFMEISRQIFEYLILALEYASAGIITFGILFAAIFSIVKFARKTNRPGIYHSFRVMVGRCIILGLEILIAADIIRSLTLSFTLRSVGLLGLIIIIRTFLSFSLEVEMNGRWPWQRK
jgi:uncharacterized membrane protein